MYVAMWWWLLAADAKSRKHLHAIFIVFFPKSIWLRCLCVCAEPFFRMKNSKTILYAKNFNKKKKNQFTFTCATLKKLRIDFDWKAVVAAVTCEPHLRNILYYYDYRASRPFSSIRFSWNGRTTQTWPIDLFMCAFFFFRCFIFGRIEGHHVLHDTNYVPHKYRQPQSEIESARLWECKRKRRWVTFGWAVRLRKHMTTCIAHMPTYIICIYI